MYSIALSWPDETPVRIPHAHGLDATLLNVKCAYIACIELILYINLGSQRLLKDLVLVCLLKLKGRRESSAINWDKPVCTASYWHK